MSIKSDSVYDLGLMGGMFDPVHYGHLQTAQNILLNLELDEVHLLPCGQPVHREAIIANAEQRIKMLELALISYEKISVDDRECCSKEPSYTFNSLQAIHQANPDYRLYTIMGQDAFNSLDTWFRWQDLFSLAHIVVAARPGYEPSLSPALEQEFRARQVGSVDELKQSGHGKILITQMDLLDISSSRVREKISRHEPIEDLLPVSVATYIQASGLYTPEERS